MMVEWDEHMGDLMNGTSPFINNYIYILIWCLICSKHTKNVKYGFNEDVEMKGVFFTERIQNTGNNDHL